MSRPRRVTRLSGSAVPPLLAPTPVTETSGPLLGRRLIWHRHDTAGDVPDDPAPVTHRGPWTVDGLRAGTEPYEDTEGTYVIGVLAEEDFWRWKQENRHVEPTEIPTVDLFTIEFIPDVESEVSETVFDGALMADDAPYTSHGRVHEPTRPPIRRLRLAVGQNALVGLRAWMLPNTANYPRSGYRVVSEPYLDNKPEQGERLSGDNSPEPKWTYVRLATESGYFLARATGAALSGDDCMSVPINTVFVE